jgi:hypothetical protein
MQFFSAKTDYVDVDLYDRRLNRDGFICVDLVGLGIYSNYQACVAETYQRLCLQFMNVNSRIGYSDLGRESVIGYLSSVEGVPLTSFRKKGVQGQSIDRKKVLMPLFENGYAQDFFDLYFHYVDAKARRSDTKKVFDRNISNDMVEGWDGQVLYKVPFVANKQVNLRFNYSNEDIIGFPREIKYLVQAPKGYVLAWGDFAQSDARIAFNTLLKDEKTLPLVLEYPDDIYAGFANLVSEHTFNELSMKLEEAKIIHKVYDEASGENSSSPAVDALTEKLRSFQKFSGFSSAVERDAYKLNSLRVLYGTRRDSVREVSMFVSRFAEVLKGCQKYRKFWDDLSVRSTFGLPIRIKCYMGHTEYITSYEGSKVNEALFKGLNYPVQGGTSEMMILLVNKLLDRFGLMGYSEDDVRVYYCRHDEPIFLVREEVMKDSWVFKDFETIIVDDWIPLKMSFSFGTVYGESSKELESLYESSVSENSEKISVVERGPSVDYYPLSKMLELGVWVVDLGDGTDLLDNGFGLERHSGRLLVVVFSEELMKADVKIVNSSSPFNVVVNQSVSKCLKKAHLEGYRLLVITNQFVGQHVEEIGVPISRVYRTQKTTALHKANIIALSALSKMKGVSDPIVEENRWFLENVSKLNFWEG